MRLAVYRMRDARSRQNICALVCIAIDYTRICCCTAQTREMNSASLSPTTATISSIGSYLSIMMLLHQDILVERKHTFLSRETCTDRINASGYASTFVLARFASARSLRHHHKLRSALCRFRQSAGNPSRGTLSSDFRLTVVGRQGFGLHRQVQ